METRYSGAVLPRFGQRVRVAQPLAPPQAPQATTLEGILGGSMSTYLPIAIGVLVAALAIGFAVYYVSSQSNKNKDKDLEKRVRFQDEQERLAEIEYMAAARARARRGPPQGPYRQPVPRGPPQGPLKGHRLVSFPWTPATCRGGTPSTSRTKTGQTRVGASWTAARGAWSRQTP